jgi:hypothetical protein
MRNYAPFLLYQVARFGALTIPQMLAICDGKCKKSALYVSVKELVDAKLLLPILNGATRTRAYYATKEGRRTVLGSDFPAPSGIRASELDHTVGAAQVLLELCRYENVTGIAAPYEMRPEEIARFCYERVPDGIVRLTQDGDDFELAVELETSVKATDNVQSVLDRYWQTIRRQMECYGVLIVGTSPEILRRYTHALSKMPPEFGERVKLLGDIGLKDINPKAFGQKTKAISDVVEITRTSSTGEIRYSPVKSELFLAQTAFTVPTPTGRVPNYDRRS